MSTETTTTKYKYLNLKRVNSTIKKYGVELIHNKNPDSYFYFLDLKTGDQVGESVMVAKLYHLSIQKWRDFAAEARASVTEIGTTQEDAAKVRELLESLEEPESVGTRASRIARNVVAQGIAAEATA